MDRSRERALTAGPEWLKPVFDSVNAAIFIHDIDTGDILEVNKRVQEMYGYTSEDVRRVGVAELSSNEPPYTREEAVALMQKAATGEPQLFEWHARDRAGRLFWVEVNIQRVHIGERDYLLVTVRDISERKKAEAAIHESEQRYREIFELTEDGIFFVDVMRNGRFTFASFNPAAEKATGLTTDRARGKHPEDFLSPAEAATANAHYRRCVESGKTIRYDEEFRVGDREVAADMTLIPLRDETGRIYRLIGVAHFVFERRQRERALTHSENLLKEAQRIGHIGHWEYDFAAGRLQWSDEVYHIFGVAHPGFPGTEEAFEAYIHPGDRARVDAAYDAAIGSRSEFDITYRIVRPGGEVRIVHERGRADYDAQGKPRRLIGVVQDVTEAKRSEEALKQEKAFSDAVISSIAGTFLVLDAQGRYIRWNKTIEDLVGKTADELYLFEGINLIYGPDRSAVWARIRRAFETGYSEGEARVLGRDGVLRNFYFVGRRVRINGSNFDIVTGIDITRRKHAETALKESYAKLRGTVNGIIDTITAIVETRDPYTAGHQQRVSLLATAIAREMRLPDATVDSIRVAALMHDIGKIYVPSEILSRPGALSEAEKSIIRTYPRASYDILKSIEFPWPVASIALEHQERYNGSGYPRHIAGTKISLEARILAVADVVEAMLSHRPYRGARGVDEAIDEIIRNKGTLFDPDVVDACVRLFREKRFSFEEAEKNKEQAIQA